MSYFLPRLRRGHTLIELVAALMASALLLAGLGSVMLIARQIAYTPSAATNRLDAAKIIGELADELQLATFIKQRSATILEFVVADRDGDGGEEHIRYNWSGTVGSALYRTYNSGDPIVVLASVQDFHLDYTIQNITTPVETTTDGAEELLTGNTTLQTTNTRDITSTNWSAQLIDPATFTAAAPSNTLYWNATRAEFQGATSGTASGTLLVQLRSTGTPYNGPTSHALAQASISEASLSTSLGWNSAQFSNPARNLPLHRKYALVWATPDAAAAGRVRTDTLATSNVSETSDAGASWQYITPKQIYYRLYGKYTTPGPTYNVTRSYLSNVAVRLQSSAQTHSRVDASISLTNLPELLSAYWRTDFDRDPTTSDVNGDVVGDWQAIAADEVVGAQPYDSSSLSGGIWRVKGKLRTHPVNNFSNPTTVEVRFRDTSIGNTGAVAWIHADWVSGQAAALSVTALKVTDSTQSLILSCQTSSSSSTVLFQQDDMSTDFMKCRLTILPAYNLVNVQVNDVDLGTYSYTTYALPSTNRYAYLYGDTTTAEFDYAEVRVSESN